MNHLPRTADDEWTLPDHAHIVVYEPDDRDRGLLTIYDCGYAQKPPRAKLLGNLADVEAAADVQSTPTGRTVTLREGATLVADGPDRFSIQ